MNTPIVDFVNAYADKDFARFHMPGHKGAGELESRDITEIFGADSLYDADGIIEQSEKNASKIFGSHATFYSCEGSSLSIKASVYLCVTHTQNKHILASRNVHKAFVSACALVGADVQFLESDANSLLATSIDLKQLKNSLATQRFAAVYITTPDYLGNLENIKQIASICHEHDTLLIVDNAHGAYLTFFDTHPITLGADIVCDSAHKTLPVLTGGAYLHIANENLVENAKSAMALFGSTSPSYLILQSLDSANKYMSECAKDEYLALAKTLEKQKASLRLHGYSVISNEPIKFTIDCAQYGYSGVEIANVLRSENIEVEYSDCYYITLMFTPKNTQKEIQKLVEVLKRIPKKQAIQKTPDTQTDAKRVFSIRQAYFSKSENVDVDYARGRVCAKDVCSCPPAVPIVLPGELINDTHVLQLKKYGFKTINVIKKDS